MASMRIALCTVLAGLMLPAAGLADPPAHAPAHGRRAKEANHQKRAEPSGGVAIHFDSSLGLHVAIGLPGVYFQAGSYYRHDHSGWHVSKTGTGGWSLAARSSIPEKVRKAHPAPPAKAKGHKPGKKHKRKK
jgi:hypothetical protein